MNFKNNIRLLSIVSLFIASLLILPLVVSFLYKEGEISIVFLYSILISSLTAAFFYLFARNNKDKNINIRDGYFFVTFSWVIATILGTMPFILYKNPLSFSSAVFEVMSGFTTTGATVISDVEIMPRSLLFWRSETNWIGGMGIVVLFVALVPTLGSGGMKFFSSETVGPTKDKIMPKSRVNAMLLYFVYLVFTLLSILVLNLCGLNLYESVTATFSAVSTAGFSIKNMSIAGFNSSSVEVALTVIMFLAGVNFTLFYLLYKKRNFNVFKDEEFLFYSKIVIICSVLMAVNLYANGIYKDIWTSMRYSFFQFVSFITTTGFSTADYRMWPLFSKMILFLSMFVGGCAGSTGGGVKVVRLLVVYKVFGINVKNLIHPRGVFPLHFNHSSVSDRVFTTISSFLVMYYSIAILGAVLVSLLSKNIVDIETALSASVLCLGNIGAGFGDTSLFTSYSPSAHYLLSFLMLVGRLELFTVLSLFNKSYWRR